MMRTILKALSLLVLPLFLASCATSSLTNLTPSTYPRNATGQYMVEMEMDTTQQTLIPSSLNPMVVIGFDSYPMRPTAMMNNRWETVVPVPAAEKFVHYHFKVDYEYNSIGKPQKGSKLSQGYTVEIVDR